MTALAVPAGIDAAEFLKLLETRYGVKLAGGQLTLKGKIVRIAHMGIIDELDILGTLGAIELVLKELGQPVKLGAGMAAANRVFAESLGAKSRT